LPALPATPAPDKTASNAADSAAPRPTEPAACLEWGNFVGTDLKRAEAAIARLQLGNKLSTRTVGDITAYWVYIPPLKTKRDVEKKIKELGKLGVTGYFHIQDSSKWNSAISLEIFRSEEAAKKFIADLRKKGVKSAVIGERSLKQVVLVIREPAADIAAKMVELKQEFAGSELKAAQCEMPTP